MSKPLFLGLIIYALVLAGLMARDNPSASVLAVTPNRPHSTARWRMKLMPAPLPANQKQFEDLFRGNATIQTQAIRDALMNYHRLMEREGKTVYEPKAAPVEAAGGE